MDVLEGIEEERKNEIRCVNMQREAFNEREKDIQSLEDEIKWTLHKMTTLSLSKYGFAEEINDLVRAQMD